MKANELRIYNYVLAEVGLPSLNIHCILANDIVDISKGFVNVSPIPLTEEWLLKFGFTQCENEYWYEKGFFGISHEGCVNLQGRGNNEFVAEAVIKYVHQLQNIYYALTGSELQIGNLTEH